MPADLSWAVKAAGRAKVVVSGEAKTDEAKFITHVKTALAAGAAGAAVGRNIWKHKHPVEITRKLKKIIFP